MIIEQAMPLLWLFDAVESAALRWGTSAQAELYALTRACVLVGRKRANIYSDSRYAFGVVHDFGQLWHYCGFITASGHPIQHADMVAHLLKDVLLPTKIAVIKCEAHTNADTEVARGNALADAVAKESMLCTVLAVP